MVLLVDHFSSLRVVSSTWNGDLSRMELMGKGFLVKCFFLFFRLNGVKSFDSCSKSHSNGFYLPLPVWLLQERHPAGLWLKHSCDLRKGREGLKLTDGCGGIDGGQKKSVELQDFSGNLKKWGIPTLQPNQPC